LPSRFFPNRGLLAAVLFFLLLACSNEDVVQLPNAQRVVSLAPNITEMVYAVGAGKKLVGTDNFSDYPPPAKALPKVGGTQPNVEKIIALKPDLVLASTSAAPPGLESSLRAADIPIAWIRTDRLSELPGAMGIVGGHLGVLDVPVYVKRLMDGIAAQKRTRAHPPRVMFVVWTNPLYVAGRNTYVGDLIEHCGATNAVLANGWPQYSLESFVANPPDIILYPNVSVTEKAMRDLLDSAPGVRAHARAVPVDENVFVRPGPRVVQAARQLNAILDGTGDRSQFAVGSRTR
jgi:ABC-type hemin transport system substrate-binding protein